MIQTAPKRRRCAVYTRVSTDHGLDQEFNSLDAQREAAEAYIKSQGHEGWSLIKTTYNDGGFSGASIERPAMQRLLADIKAGKIDIVVTYKVDRLTRSLADFARLVELFEDHQVSFVSVTQSFNTTTSMGRLTLNLLLSFAQFEREVTSERIRDKIAASKKRGLWVGGMVPLGYASRDKKLVLVEEEAERVRYIFQRYLALGSLDRLLHDLREKGIVTKLRPLSNGRTIGGIPFTRGPLAYLLRNRFYIGEIVYRGTVSKAEHEPLLDRDLYEAVQDRLSQQHRRFRKRRGQSGALLMGKLFDDRGHRMTPAHTRKKGAEYGYYISSALNQGQRDKAGTISRVSAKAVEAPIVEALRQRVATHTTTKPHELIERHLVKATLRIDVLELEFRPNAGQMEPANAGEDDEQPATLTIHLPWSRVPSRRARDIILPISRSQPNPRPIRSETRATLVRAIARGRRWLNELVDGTAQGPGDIAAREGCSTRHVTMTMSLAFLAPDLVQAAIAGRLPRGVGVAKLSDPPLEWARQWAMLGLAPKALPLQAALTG